MTLKNRVILLLVVSGALTAGVMVMLAVAYLNNFPTWSTLFLLLTVLLTITGWALYYVALQKYKEENDPKRKRYGKGNRKNRRKER